jgi:hypothetical protein
MEILEINNLLLNASTIKRRKAAKEIQKTKTPEVGESLYKAFIIELQYGEKHWETNVEIIRAIGMIDLKMAIRDIFELCRKKIEYDMITIAAATAYIRLKRQSLADISSVFELLEIGGYSVSMGALDAVGYDMMMPSNNDIKKLINLCWDIGSNRDKDAYVDPRYGLVAACAGWDKYIVKEFLLHCLNTGDRSVQKLAQASLKGKYFKLR